MILNLNEVRFCNLNRGHSGQVFVGYIYPQTQNFGPKMDDTSSEHTVEASEGLFDLLKRLEEGFIC